MKIFNTEEVIRNEVLDQDREGVFQAVDGTWQFDRRLTVEAVGQLGLTPRTADLNLIGPSIIEVPSAMFAELDLDTI